MSRELLDVKLFGNLIILSPDGDLVNLAAPRVQELFCYLVIQSEQAHPREALLDLFWNTSSLSQARRNLRQTLWQLQKTLDSYHHGSGIPLIRATNGWLQLNHEAPLRTDVAAFEGAFSQVSGIPGDLLDPEQAKVLQSAVELYRGDLLEGWYQDWCLIERERLQNIYLSMLDKLMCFCDAHQLYDIGLIYGERALRYDRANERVHRHIMRLLYGSGNRSAALHQYDHCVTALLEELGVSPSTHTSELYRQISADTLDRPTHAVSTEPAKPGARSMNSLLNDVLNRLRRMQSAVAAVQVQLHQDIQSIEQVIEGRRR